MNNVSENKLLDFERKNKTIIEEISNSIFDTILKEFESYKDVKDNYRMTVNKINQKDCKKSP